MFKGRVSAQNGTIRLSHAYTSYFPCIGVTLKLDLVFRHEAFQSQKAYAVIHM